MTRSGEENTVMHLSREDQEWLDGTLDRIVKKMEAVRERNAEKIPAVAVKGVYDDRADQSIEWDMDNGINWWTNGFWGGIMWQLYHYTGDERYMEIARISEEKMDRCFSMYYGLHHDVGFMWLPTAAADWRLTKNPESRKRALLAASLLAGRFNPAGKFIRAWNDNVPGQTESNRGWAIIDCLFNIPLLYWASEEIDDPRFKEIAMLHADTVAENFIRKDGSVRHIVEFDPVTGEMVRELGGQGYAEGTSWTRGQTWAIYGFAISFRHTKKESYLEAAKKAADRFLSRIPADCHIPVDFDQPEDPHIEDSTAAAVAAGGFLELSRMIPDRAEAYRNAGIRLLKTLAADRCDFSPEIDGILSRCTGSYHGEKDREVNFVYADYYFIEALLKLKGCDVKIW